MNLLVHYTKNVLSAFMFLRHRVYITVTIVAKTQLTARPGCCLIFYGLRCTSITPIKIKKNNFWPILPRRSSKKQATPYYSSFAIPTDLSVVTYSKKFFSRWLSRIPGLITYLLTYLPFGAESFLRS